eukprot:1320921-Rhodomonas_salina.1
MGRRVLLLHTLRASHFNPLPDFNASRQKTSELRSYDGGGKHDRVRAWQVAVASRTNKGPWAKSLLKQVKKKPATCGESLRCELEKGMPEKW